LKLKECRRRSWDLRQQGVDCPPGQRPVLQQRTCDALNLVAVTAHQGAGHATQPDLTAGPLRRARARIKRGHELVDIVAVDAVAAVVAADRPKAFKLGLAASHAHQDPRAASAQGTAQQLSCTALRYRPAPILNGLPMTRLGVAVGLPYMVGDDRGGAPEQTEHPTDDSVPGLVVSETLQATGPVDPGGVQGVPSPETARGYMRRAALLD